MCRQRRGRCAVRTVAGTEWCFARPEFDPDTRPLFIDGRARCRRIGGHGSVCAQRGVVAISDAAGAAHSGAHRGVGALRAGILLGDHATVPPRAGHFWGHAAMHTDVCEFVSAAMTSDESERHEVKTAEPRRGRRAALKAYGISFRVRQPSGLPAEVRGGECADRSDVNRLAACSGGPTATAWRGRWEWGYSGGQPYT